MKGTRLTRWGSPNADSQRTQVSNTTAFAHDPAIVVHQYTSCMIDADRLPWIPAKPEYAELPPPFCDGQELTHYSRSRFGHLLVTQEYRAAGGAWHLISATPTALSVWQKVVLFS